MSDSNVLKPLVLADIDDNLCHTVGKFRKYVGDETQLGSPCVIDDAGKALSFRSRKQTAMLDWLMGSAIVVPVTGRSQEKFLQVKLGFTGHAIVSFGGVILLADGSPEPVWFDHIGSQARAQKEAIDSLLAAAKVAAAEINDALKVSVITDVGLDLLIKVQHKDVNNAELAVMAEQMAGLIPYDWTLHANEGQLCAYPPFLGKEKACTYYLENLAPPHSLLIGSGDSLTDVGFIGMCDFMLAPTQSQVFQAIAQHC